MLDDVPGINARSRTRFVTVSLLQPIRPRPSLRTCTEARSSSRQIKLPLLPGCRNKP